MKFDKKEAAGQPLSFSAPKNPQWVMLAALLLSYAENLMQYLDYYLAFEGVQGDMVSGLIDDKLDELGQIYLLAGYAGRRDAVARLNDYYRTLGATDEDLLHVDAPGEPTDSLLPIP